MSSRSSAAAVALALSLLSVSPLAQAPPLPDAVAALRHDIDAVLSAPALGRGFWGILVKPVDGGEALYSRNADKLMMPASTMKVVTLAAAAQRLGWDFTYSTRLFTAGTISNGALHGDLVVVGSGDPNFDDWDGIATRVFADWATELKAAGIASIEGRIVGDDNAFDDEGLGFGWSWDDVASSFSANVSGLQFNEGSVQLRIAPGASVGAKAIVTITPDFSGLTVGNRMTTGPAGSAGNIVRRRLPGSSRLEIRGSLPLRGRAFTDTASVENPTLYFATALRRALIANGIEVKGPAVDIDDLDAAPQRSAAPIATYQSPPLSVLATTMMKLSQNLFAESMLKTLGIDSVERLPGTSKAGMAAVRSVLQDWNIDPAGLVQADGSGLSRYNYITPETMVAVLTHVQHDERLRSTFEATLPLAGKDGTVEYRMRGTAADGHARVKTGSLTNVRSGAGYVHTAGGDTLSFVIFANNYDNSSAVVNAATDAIIVRLAAFHR